MRSPLIRPYRPSDRRDVERICAATGLGGELAERFCDPELFAKLWLSAFLDLSPEACLVAEREGRVEGYLVGTLDERFNRRAALHLARFLPTLVGRWASGRYRSHPPSGQFVSWLLLHSWREHPRTPSNSCHFHFNVDPQVQGSGHGIRLAKAFVAQALSSGKTRWHAVVFTGPGRRSVRFFEKMGFEIHDRRPTRLLGPGAEIACIVSELGSASMDRATQPLDGPQEQGPLYSFSFCEADDRTLFNEEQARASCPPPPPPRL